MTDEKGSKVEVMSPISHEAEMPLDRPLQGTSFLNRAKYWVVSRELKAYIDALKLRNAAMTELIRTGELKDKYYGETLTRARRLEDIRKIAGYKIDEELDELLDAREERDVRKIDRDRRKLELKKQVILAKRELDEIENPPPPDPKAALSRGQQAVAEIKRIEADFAEIRKAFVESANGEENLSDHDKNLLEQMEVARRNALSDLLESLK